MKILMDGWQDYTPKEVDNILKLSKAFEESWSSITAYPTDVSRWVKEKPGIGQCAVTALIVQDYLKGKIVRNSEFKHYWNILPNGKKIDYTHHQFGIQQAIPSEGEIQRDDILKGQRAIKANTKERYKILKQRVQDNLKLLKPTIWLFSSNAQTEYIKDIIEVAGMPEGSIHHYRYMIYYLDPSLQSIIPLQGENVPEFLKDAQVVIVYLNQTRLGNRNYVWNNTLPIRLGVLKDCYKTSHGQNAAIHFFFELKKSILPRNSWSEELKKELGENYKKYYAFITYSNLKGIVIEDNSKNIFEDQCLKLLNTGLSYEDKEHNRTIVYNSPLMVLIEGVYEKRFLHKAKEIKPRYDNFSHKAFYKLTEATSYIIKYRTFVSPYQNSFKIKVNFPKNSFATPEEYTEDISSSYHSECLEFEPVYVEKGLRGYFEFFVNSVKQPQEKDLSNLDWKIIFSYNIKRKISIRIMDNLINFLWVLGPTYLAITKIVDYPTDVPKPWYITDWYYILPGIYIIWFLIKIFANLVRGK